MSVLRHVSPLVRCSGVHVCCSALAWATAPLPFDWAVQQADAMFVCNAYTGGEGRACGEDLILYHNSINWQERWGLYCSCQSIMSGTVNESFFFRKTTRYDAESWLLCVLVPPQGLDPPVGRYNKSCPVSRGQYLRFLKKRAENFFTHFNNYMSWSTGSVGSPVHRCSITLPPTHFHTLSSSPSPPRSELMSALQ